MTVRFGEGLQNKHVPAPELRSDQTVKTETANHITVIIARLAVFCWAFAVHAQEPAESRPMLLMDDIAPTVEQLMAQRATVEADTSLTEDQKATALNLYDRAVQATRATEELQAETATVRQNTSAAPARIAELSALIEQADRAFEVTPERFADTPTEELVELAETARRDFETAWEALHARGLSLRQVAMLPAGDTLGFGGDFGPRLDEDAGGDGHAGSDLRDAIELARKYLQSARVAEERARRRLTREQLASFDLLLRLELLEVEGALLEVSRREATYESLARAVEARRAKDARVARENAEVTAAAMSEMPDAMRQLALDNLAFRRESEKTLQLEAQAARRMRATRSRLGIHEMNFKLAGLQTGGMGPNRAVGRMIRDRLENMPSLMELEQIAASRRDERARVVERRVDLTRKVRKLLLPGTMAASTLDSIPRSRRTELGEDWVRSEVRTLLQAQRESSETLYAILSRYLWVLATLDDTEGRIAAAVSKSQTLAREDLLWIPDLPRISLNDVSRVESALQWLSSGDVWRATLRSGLESFRVRPWSSLALLVSLIVLVYCRSAPIRSGTPCLHCFTPWC